MLARTEELAALAAGRLAAARQDAGFRSRQVRRAASERVLIAAMARVTAPLPMRRDLSRPDRHCCAVAASAFASIRAWHGVFGGERRQFSRDRRVVSRAADREPGPQLIRGGSRSIRMRRRAVSSCRSRRSSTRITATAVVIRHGRDAATEHVERIAAFVPPVLGTLTVIVVWALGAPAVRSPCGTDRGRAARGPARAFSRSHDARLRRSSRARSAAGDGHAARARASRWTEAARAGRSARQRTERSPRGTAGPRGARPRSLPAGLGERRVSGRHSRRLAAARRGARAISRTRDCAAGPRSPALARSSRWLSCSLFQDPAHAPLRQPDLGCRPWRAGVAGRGRRGCPASACRDKAACHRRG